MVRIYSMCALLPQLQGWFMALTQGNSCELFISGEDKRKSQLYYPDGVSLFTQQTGLIGELLRACITHIWSAFSEAINCSPCVQTNPAQDWYVLNTKRYLSEHQFLLCLLPMLTSRHFILMTHSEKGFSFRFLLKCFCLDPRAHITTIKCAVWDCRVIQEHTEECMSLCALICLP